MSDEGASPLLSMLLPSLGVLPSMSPLQLQLLLSFHALPSMSPLLLTLPPLLALPPLPLLPLVALRGVMMVSVVGRGTSLLSVRASG